MKPKRYRRHRNRPSSAKQRRELKRSHKRFMAKHGEEGVNKLTGLLKWAYAGEVKGRICGLLPSTGERWDV